MAHFGEDLRKEREARNVALPWIAELTKISSRHLVALEGGRFDLLPGGVFNKGIVRGYARAVGLDEEFWIQRYLSASQASGLAKADEAEWEQFAKNVARCRKTKADRPYLRLRWAGVFLLLTLIAGLGWFVYSFVHEKVSATGGSPQTPQSGSAFLTSPRRIVAFVPIYCVEAPRNVE